MRSSLFFITLALPLGFAHNPLVVTKYVTVCEPSLSNGYTLSNQSPTYGAGSAPEESSPAQKAGKGYSSSEYGSVGSPGYEGGSTSTCTDEGEGGYGSGGSGGYHATSSYGQGYGGTGPSGTVSGYSSSHTPYGNHSSTSHVSGSGSHTSSKTSSTSSSSASTSPTFVPGCTNSATTRGTWCNGFSIDTDEQLTWPVTGKVRHYDLEITNTTFAPDGFQRLGLLINNQYPGPVIEADWGDTLEITVTNSLQSNGTGIHWHGLRQLNTCNMDGTNGVTECPIAPGQKKTYTFIATEHGTSWYHSHYSSQYGDGVLGTIKINGPATANYDIDLGTYPITEWYHSTVFQNTYYSTYFGGASPIADNGLINGKMVSPDGTTGSYSKTTITKGKSYRLRLINTSVDNHFKVSLDGHKFKVITADFVPIVPYTTDWLFIGIGQRYDVIITADQAVNNYWFRAQVMTTCSATNNNNGNIKSIFHYEGASNKNPTTAATAFNDDCIDETSLVPHVSKSVPSAEFEATYKSLTVALGSGVDSHGNNVVRWTIGNTPINVNWDTPTLKYVADGNTNYPAELNIQKMPTRGQWYYWVVQSTDGVPSDHPIHLHGHDFSVLGTGGATFDSSQISSLNFKNPTRRDVAMLPRSGWLVVAFQADNPGAWLMHCHVAWHVSQGFAVQFVEIETEIAATMDLGSLGTGAGGTCATWASYEASKAGEVYVKDDSGLKRM